MKEIKIEKCPFCGGEEIIETRDSSSGGVSLERKIRAVGLYFMLWFAAIAEA